MIIDGQNFFIKKRSTTLRGAYKHFGVRKKSYMGSVVERIFDFYCHGAEKLYSTYQRYYKKEFPCFKAFLQGRFNLFSDEATALATKQTYHKDFRSQPENNVRCLLMDDPIIGSSVKSFLDSEGGEQNED